MYGFLLRAKAHLQEASWNPLGPIPKGSCNLARWMVGPVEVMSLCLFSPSPRPQELTAQNTEH